MSKNQSPKSKPHVWRYATVSRTRQVRIETADDLRHLGELDAKCWTVLAATVEGVRFDARTLHFLDADGDGRIRRQDVVDAVAWTLAHVDDPAVLFTPPAEELAAQLADVARRQALLDAAEPFAADKAALAAWEAEPAARPEILPLGAETERAEQLLAAVETAVDAYFAVPDDLPLVTDEPDKTLPLGERLNPKWAGAVHAFARAIVAPVLHKESDAVLTRADWETIKAAFAPYRAWRAAKPVVAADAKKQLEDEEKLLRYRLHLVSFLRNFVTLADLYDPARPAAFQTGQLYLAGRCFALCFHVADEAAHAVLAQRAECCAVYAKLTHPRTGAGTPSAKAPQTVCAVVTAGTVAPLYVGRNGVFFDRDGVEWDAVVTRVLPAETSLAEAFWAPWKKVADTISDQVRKLAGERQDAALAAVTKAATLPAAPKAAAPAANAGNLAGTVAALGVGMGMAGAAFAGIVGMFTGLPWWKTLATLVAVLLAVSLPSVFLANLKLRRRDLGAILNACGWAVNRPLRLTAAAAHVFTQKKDF